MATNLPSCFSIQCLEQLLKFLVNFTLLKYVKSQRSYSFLITRVNHKRADFWLPNFGFKRSLLSLLKLFINVKTFPQKSRRQVLWKKLTFINFMLRKGTKLRTHTHTITNGTLLQFRRRKISIYLSEVVFLIMSREFKVFQKFYAGTLHQTLVSLSRINLSDINLKENLFDAIISQTGSIHRNAITIN